MSTGGLFPGIRLPLLAGAVLVLLFGLVAVRLLGPGLYAEQTDDAVVEAHVVALTPKVAAYVKALHFDDNARVSAGSLLLELDPRDLEAQVVVARAALAASRGKLREMQDQILLADSAEQEARLAVGAVQADAQLAGLTLQRLNEVADERAVAASRIDEARAALTRSQALVEAASARVVSAAAQARQARSQAATAQAAVAQAAAALAQAELNLSYTRLYATTAGTVANRSVEAGNYVEAGQVLAVLVPDQSYVIANYKETQLRHIRPGLPVEITADALPDVRLNGRVESIQRATGARFAALPPENATGNFVKVVQRVPVKIVFEDPAEAARWLSPGMSVETAVQFARPPAWLPH